MNKVTVKVYVDGEPSESEQDAITNIVTKDASKPVERSFRLPIDVAMGVEELAERDMRSMNNMAAVLLREALTARGWSSQPQTG